MNERNLFLGESFNNIFGNSNSYDYKQTIEFFKIIYDIYKISYYKTHERKYLCVLAELNRIKKDFEKNNYALLLVMINI